MPIDGWSSARVAAFVVLLSGSLLAAPGWAGSGEKFYEELRKQDALLDDPELLAYVRAVGQRLVDVSEMAGREFHFYVVDSDTVNAQAHEDAYIFVYRGLLLHMDTEAQLAAVLGHEIGHVTGRHTAGKQSRSVLTNLAGLAAAIMTGRGELMNVANTAGGAWIAGYGRELELEADRSGARYLALAGYDPYAMVEVVQILKDKADFQKKVNPGAQNYHGVFATHPKNDRRLQEVVGEAERYASDEQVEPIGDVLQYIEGLRWGDQIESGVVRDNVYYNLKLRFVVSFPEGWKLFDSPRRMTGEHPDASDVFVNLEVQALDDKQRRISPEKYIHDYLGIEETRNGRELEFQDKDEMSGYIAEVPLEKDAKAAMRTIAVVYWQGRAHVFRGEVGEVDHAAGFPATFADIVASFRPLQRKDLDVANSHRVVVVEARPGDTYESLARISNMGPNAAQQLRLLNGDYPNGQPHAGDRVKIVQ